MKTPNLDRVPLSPGEVELVPVPGKPNRYILSMADSPIVPGKPVNKAAMDEWLAASGTTTGTAVAFALAQEGYSLFDGALVRVKFHVKTGDAPTIRVGGTAAIPIQHWDGRGAQNIPAGVWFDMIYSSTAGAYILQGVTTVPQLTTARTIQTDLSSNEAVPFDGTRDIQPGVTGVLDVKNGGTGSIYGTVAGAFMQLNDNGGGTFILPRPPSSGVMLFINANETLYNTFHCLSQYVPDGGVATDLYAYGVEYVPAASGQVPDVRATLNRMGAATLSETILYISNLGTTFRRQPVGILIL